MASKQRPGHALLRQGWPLVTLPLTMTVAVTLTMTLLVNRFILWLPTGYCCWLPTPMTDPWIVRSQLSSNEFDISAAPSPGWVGLLLFSVICRLCQLFEQLSKHAIPFMIDDTVSTQFFLGKKSLHRFLCLVAWNASLKSYGQANLCHFCDDIVKTVLNNIKNMSFSSLMGWQTYNFCSPSSGW